MPVLLAAILALAQPLGEPVAAPAPSFTLIDGGGAARSVRLLSLEGRSVVFLDQSGRRRTEGDALVLLADPAPARTQSAATTYAELIDGQRLPGVLGPGRSESIRWRLAIGVETPIALDRLSTLVLKPGAPLAPPTTGDSVVLVNGDVLSGFVAEVGENVRVESGGRVVEVPADRAASISFLNTRARPRGTLLYLADGTVAGVVSFEYRGGAGVGELAIVQESGEGSATIPAPAAEITAVVLESERLHALGLIAPSLQQPVGPRRWMPPLVVEDSSRGPAPTMLMPGPMVVEWPLPERARRFAARLSLPPDCRDWGDLDAFVEAGSGGSWSVLAREHLHAESYAAEINAVIPAGATTLRVRIDERDSGPIQDRLQLDRAFIFVEP